MAKKTRPTTYDQGLADGMRALDPISMNKSYLSGYHAGQAARQSQTSREVQQRLREVQAERPIKLGINGGKRSHATKARRSVRDRILDKIEQYSGTTSTGLVAADLRLSPETVKRQVAALIKEGLVQYGYDGNALELTAEAHRERAIDRRVASHR